MRKLSHCGVAFCLGVNGQTNPSTTFFFSVKLLYVSDPKGILIANQKQSLTTAFWVRRTSKAILMQFLRSSFHSSLFWPKRSFHGLALTKRFRYWHWEVSRLKSWFRAIGVFNNDFLGFSCSPVRPLPSGNFSGSIHNKDSDSNEKVSPKYKLALFLR